MGRLRARTFIGEREMKTAYIETTHSPDDGGYYAEVSSTNGKTVHDTKIFSTRKAAYNAAAKWARKFGATPIHTPVMY